MAPSTKKPFDYTLALKAICCDICAKVPEFQRYDPFKIGYSFMVARNKSTRYGCWASMTPLRFENGAMVCVKEAAVLRLNGLGQRIRVVDRVFYKTPEVKGPSGENLLYIFNVTAPRFLDLTITEKLETIMHELYHINPKFNGDVRRFPGRNWQHGNKAAYDAVAKKLARMWLASEPDPRLYEFLRYTTKELQQLYGNIVGTKFTRIPLIKIAEEEALRLGWRG